MKPAGAVRLTVVPCELDEANAFVEQHHRHLGRVVGHRFSLAVADPAGAVRGVAIVGRPIGKSDQDGWTVQILRSATDGCPNAPSALNGACRRVAFGLGYTRLLTFNLISESGDSMKAVGFKCIGLAGKKDGAGWSSKSRPRVDEPVLWADPNDLPENVIPNLRWLIPMARSRQRHDWPFRIYERLSGSSQQVGQAKEER